MSLILDQLENFVISLKEQYPVHVCKSRLNIKIPCMKYAILDFEFDYPKFLGILIHNRIYQFYIQNNDKPHKESFFYTIYTILSLLREFYLFAFSNYESLYINNTLRYEIMRVYPNEDFSFFDSLQLINLQFKNRNYEALVAAVISLGIEPYYDPILRDTKKMEFFFKEKRFDLILAHNISCLINTFYVLFFRFFKETLVFHRIDLKIPTTLIQRRIIGSTRSKDDVKENILQITPRCDDIHA